MVVLTLRKTVVQQQSRTQLQMVRKCADKGLALRMHFGQVIVLTVNLDGRAQVRGLVRPHQSPLRPGHATLMPDTAHAGQQLHRHGIEHLVAHHHAAHLRRQRARPLHLAGMRRQSLTLAGF